MKPAKPPKLGSVALGKSALCQHIGCSNQGTLKPCISFASIDPMSTQRAEIRIDLLVCPEHALPDPSYFLSDKGWAQVQQFLKLQGKLAGDRKSATVKFEKT